MTTDYMHAATRDRVAQARRAAYLDLWPEAAQREAIIEAAGNRPDKMRALLADFAEIRARLPYPPDPVADTTAPGDG